jgi:FkbM family methyltransferase
MFKKIFGNDKKLKYYGTNYGGWAVDPDLIVSSDIAYSFGVGKDISFDLALIAHYHTHVHAFDPTPRCLEWLRTQRLPEEFKFHPYGLSNFDGISYFKLPPKEEYVSFSETKEKSTDSIELEVKKITTIMEELGYDRIDLLKMDIEGSEYGVLENILEIELKPKMILIEFHGTNNEMLTLEKFKDNYSLYKKNNCRDYYLISNGVLS